MNYETDIFVSKQLAQSFYSKITTAKRRRNYRKLPWRLKNKPNYPEHPSGIYRENRAFYELYEGDMGLLPNDPLRIERMIVCCGVLFEHISKEELFSLYNLQRTLERVGKNTFARRKRLWQRIEERT